MDLRFVVPLKKTFLIPHKVIQIGLRSQGFNKSDFNFNKEHGVNMIPMEDVHEQGLSYVSKKIRELSVDKCYLTVDIDVIDPAYAPRTGYPQIGGLNSYQALKLIRDLKGINFIGCDLVEVSPPYDSVNITSLLAANIIYEILCIL